MTRVCSAMKFDEDKAIEMKEEEGSGRWRGRGGGTPSRECPGATDGAAFGFRAEASIMATPPPPTTVIEHQRWGATLTLVVKKKKNLLDFFSSH
jgi:hypothetical protein